MDTERPAYEIICTELDKVAALLRDAGDLRERIAPSLAEIRAVAQNALPCPVMPAISMKDYTEQMPTPAELFARVATAGSHVEFHGYTFWPVEDGWSLTNPYGIDDVMQLRSVEDFDRFLTQLQRGAIIGG